MRHVYRKTTEFGTPLYLLSENGVIVDTYEVKDSEIAYVDRASDQMLVVFKHWNGDYQYTWPTDAITLDDRGGRKSE
jgi:hypothetical protein